MLTGKEKMVKILSSDVPSPILITGDKLIVV